MDADAHGNDPSLLIKQARDWLDANRRVANPLPGAQALQPDYAVYQRIAPDIIERLRLDPHDDLIHADYLYVVQSAFPLIAAERDGS